MFSVFFRYIKFFIIIIILIIFYVPIIYASGSNTPNLNLQTSDVIYSNHDLKWPIPGYVNLSSKFGYRNSPTSKASSYHSGIDIPAPEGTNLYSIDEAYVIFASWGAGGGYTITIQLINYPELKASYCHLSPIMFVRKGDKIEKGYLLGTVGPKNVYGIKNNPYKDSSGNPTNGATTGCHLHFTIKLNNKAVDPLNYYSINWLIFIFVVKYIM